MNTKVEETIQEKIEKGGLYCRVICEILGGPKEYVEKSIKAIVEKVKELDYTVLVKGEVFEPNEVEKLWSTFAEMEIIFKNKEKLFDFCYTFLPSSIEIIEPDSLELTNDEMTAWLNEFAGRLHATDKLAKESNALKQLMTKRQAQIIRYNMLSHLLDKELSSKELQKRVGIDDNSFKQYLKILVSRGEIIKNDGKLKLSEVVNFDSKK